MHRVCSLSLVLALCGVPAAGAATPPKTIDFPCFKNVGDGRVLVDGEQWDKKMKELGYRLAEGEYVPWEVLGFTQQKLRDAMWADGLCHMRLLPVDK